MGKDNRLTQLFQQAGKAYLEDRKATGRTTSATVRRTLEDIARCRTEQLGGLHISCKECGLEHRIYASCSHRNCPICPALKKELWLERRKEELLPVAYYHLVFTLPEELNILCMNHGMLAVLHTWGKNLSFHPHVHCIVPAGGLSFDGKKWVDCKKQTVIVDVKDLSKEYRKTFCRLLREAWEDEAFVFRGEAKSMKR